MRGGNDDPRPRTRKRYPDLIWFTSPKAQMASKGQESPQHLSTPRGICSEKRTSSYGIFQQSKVWVFSDWWQKNVFLWHRSRSNDASPFNLDKIFVGSRGVRNFATSISRSVHRRVSLTWRSFCGIWQGSFENWPSALAWKLGFV